MIQVQDFSKTFRDRPVVRGLSFTAPDGYITGLLGADGAGKTATQAVIVDHGRVGAQGSPGGLCRQIGGGSIEDAFVKLTRTEEPVIC
jgi:ABC-type lipopolysaccharide export system ATPase subunit